MKVLMLTDSYPPLIGGMQKHVSSLSRILVRRGHQVQVCTMFRKGLSGSGEESGVRILRIQSYTQSVPLLNSDPTLPYPPPTSDHKLAKSIDSIVREFAPDIIHCHGWMLYSAFRRRRRTNIPFVVTLHDYGLICPKRTLLLRNNRVCERPFTINCVQCGADTYGPIKSLATYAGLKINRKKLALVDRYIAVSSFVKESYCRYASILDEDIVIIPTFYEAEKSCPSPEESHKLPSDFILFVGSLVPAKGVDVLINAYTKVTPKTALVLLGKKNPANPYTQTDNITIIENAPQATVEEAYRRCSFVVIPSVFADPCPTVALEAMARRKAVIGSSIGGLTELVVDGHTGILVTPSDVTELANAMSRLMSDPREAQQMGINGYTRLTNHFSAEKIVPQIEELYKSVIKAVQGPIARERLSGWPRSIVMGDQRDYVVFGPHQVVRANGA